MADLTAEDLAFVRSRIGASVPPTDDDLNAAFTRLGTKEAVAAEVLQGRLATMLSGPQKIDIDGDVALDFGSAAKGLSGLIDSLTPGGGVTEGELYRTDRER